MAENKPEQEPSIEEILASIRQIISDDDEKPDTAPEPVAEAEPEPEPEPEEDGDDDVLELTENMQESPEVPDTDEETDLDREFDIALAEINETLSAEDDAPVEEEDMEEEPMAPELPDDDHDDIISKRAESAALASLAKLASGMPVSRPSETPRHYEGVTLEDIVRDLLHPMLRDWMDENLPPLVERLVQKEIEKLARKALDS